jgi:hypothetical protein
LEVISVSKIANINLICLKNSSCINIYFHNTTTTTTITTTTRSAAATTTTTRYAAATTTTTTTTTTYSFLQGLDYFKPILRLENL